MKTHFIKIDTSTIKPHSSFGGNMSTLTIGHIVTFSAKKLPPFFVNGKNCCITSHDSVNGIDCDFKGYITSMDLIKKIESKKNIEINLNTDISQLHKNVKIKKTDNYNFTYENTSIECNKCHQTIKFHDLKERSFIFGLKIGTIRSCPKCKASFCCKLKFESINQALKRLNK